MTPTSRKMDLLSSKMVQVNNAWNCSMSNSQKLTPTFKIEMINNCSYFNLTLYTLCIILTSKYINQQMHIKLLILQFQHFCHCNAKVVVLVLVCLCASDSLMMAPWHHNICDLCPMFCTFFNNLMCICWLL